MKGLKWEGSQLELTPNTRKTSSWQGEHVLLTIFLQRVFFSFEAQNPQLPLLSSGWHMSLNCLTDFSLIFPWSFHMYKVYLFPVNLSISIELLDQPENLEGKKKEKSLIPHSSQGKRKIDNKKKIYDWESFFRRIR